MNSIRQEQIRDYIEKNNVVTIKELQVLFPDVSLMTIHRDLDALEAAGDIVKGDAITPAVSNRPAAQSWEVSMSWLWSMQIIASVYL